MIRSYNYTINKRLQRKSQSLLEENHSGGVENDERSVCVQPKCRSKSTKSNFPHVILMVMKVIVEVCNCTVTCKNDYSCAARAQKRS